MPRRAASAASERDKIKARYKRGPRANQVLSSNDSLSETEREVKQGVAVYLKAMDFSNHYIGRALGVSAETVRQWFLNDADLRKRVVLVHKDYVDGAVELLKSYAIEAVEILMEVARESDNTGDVIKACLEVLDRVGISKVNKSESVVATQERVEITDQTGIMDAMRTAPPDVQAKVAKQLSEAMALAAEHSAEDVTHARN